MQEFVSIAVFSALVVIIAYVARRSQMVGLPPGVSRNNKPDSRTSDAFQAGQTGFLTLTATPSREALELVRSCHSTQAGEPPGFIASGRRN